MAVFMVLTIVAGVPLGAKTPHQLCAISMPLTPASASVGAFGAPAGEDSPVFRFLHGVIYTLGLKHSLRSFAWFAAFACVVWLLVVAAMRVGMTP